MSKFESNYHKSRRHFREGINNNDNDNSSTYIPFHHSNEHVLCECRKIISENQEKIEKKIQFLDLHYACKALTLDFLGILFTVTVYMQNISYDKNELC